MIVIIDGARDALRFHYGGDYDAFKRCAAGKRLPLGKGRGRLIQRN